MNLGKPCSVRLTEGLGGSLKYKMTATGCTVIPFGLSVAPRELDLPVGATEGNSKSALSRKIEPRRQDTRSRCFG